MNVVACPACSQQLKYNPQQSGKQVRCPACQAAMVLPGAPNAGPVVDPLANTQIRSQPLQPSASGSRPTTASSTPTSLRQRNVEQENLDSKVKERLQKIAQYSWVGWILIAASFLYFALGIITQSAIIGYTILPVCVTLFFGGIALLTFVNHHADTVPNTAEKFCRDCGYEVKEWKIVAKQVGLKNKYVPMMSLFNNQSKKACPNCGCFCFADSVNPLIQTLRIPSAIFVAAMVALIVFFSTDIASDALTYGFISGGVSFWTSVLFIGWPLQWLLLLIFKTTKRLVGDTRLPGPAQQQLYLHGFSKTVEPGKVTVIAERVDALDRITKWIWFAAVWALVGVVLLVPITALSKSGSLYPALAVFGIGTTLLFLNAAYFFVKDRLNLATMEVNSNELIIQETGPIKWPRSKLSLMRNQIVQFFVDTTKQEIHSEEGGYVGDRITHSLSAVTDEGRRIPLIRTENQAIGELQELEHQIEHFWGIKDVQVKEFDHGVKTYAARQESGARLNTKGRGFNARIPILVACSLVGMFIWAASGLVVGRMGFDDYREKLQASRKEESRKRSEQREWERKERQKAFLESEAEESLKRSKQPEQSREEKLKTAKIREDAINVFKEKKQRLNQWLVDRLEIPPGQFEKFTVRQLSEKLESKQVSSDEIFKFGLVLRAILQAGTSDYGYGRERQTALFVLNSHDPKGPSYDAGLLRVAEVLDEKSLKTDYSRQFENGLIVYCDPKILPAKRGQIRTAPGQFFISLERSIETGLETGVAFQVPHKALKVCYLLSSLARSNPHVNGFLQTESFHDWLLVECQKHWGLPLKKISEKSKLATIGYSENQPVPDSGGFVFLDLNDPQSPPVWGHKNGLRIGLAPAPGSNGTIRIYTPYLDQEYPQFVNRITIEPRVAGQRGRDLSELQKSKVRPNQQGLVFWASNSRVSTPEEGKTATGVVDEKLGTLRLFIHTERFDNGAQPIIECVFDRKQPYEVKLITHAAKDSTPMASCTLSAVMGNYGLLNQVKLAGRTYSPASSYFANKKLDKNGYYDWRVWRSNQLLNTSDGRFLVEFASDANFDNLNYHPDTPAHWLYKGKKAIHYWRAEADSNPVASANGRNKYWSVDTPLPVGTCFVNTELRIPFKSGRVVWFGVRPDNQ